MGLKSKVELGPEDKKFQSAIEKLEQVKVLNSKKGIGEIVHILITDEDSNFKNQSYQDLIKLPALDVLKAYEMLFYRIDARLAISVKRAMEDKIKYDNQVKK